MPGTKARTEAAETDPYAATVGSVIPEQEDSAWHLWLLTSAPRHFLPILNENGMLPHFWKSAGKHADGVNHYHQFGDADRGQTDQPVRRRSLLGRQPNLRPGWLGDHPRRRRMDAPTRFVLKRSDWRACQPSRRGSFPHLCAEP
jgi:hypothetical protein